MIRNFQECLKRMLRAATGAPDPIEEARRIREQNDIAFRSRLQVLREDYYRLFNQQEALRTSVSYLTKCFVLCRTKEQLKVSCFQTLDELEGVKTGLAKLQDDLKAHWQRAAPGLEEVMNCGLQVRYLGEDVAKTQITASALHRDFSTSMRGSGSGWAIAAVPLERDLPVLQPLKLKLRRAA